MMETFETGGLVLEATSVNEQIKSGEKEPHDFRGKTIAIVRDGKLKRIQPCAIGLIDDESTNEDGTWQVTIDEQGYFHAKGSWYITTKSGDTMPSIRFSDNTRSENSDQVHVVVGRANKAPMSTQENRIVTVGDREFLIVDNKAYEIYK